MSATDSNDDAQRAADVAARRLAVTQFDAPLVLEAGAGTGKTTTLVARVVCWSLGPGWEAHADAGGDIAGRILSRVVAITFTEAAAAEMAERVGRVLALVAEGEDSPGLPLDTLKLEPEETAHRAALLLERVDQLTVDTIHAYCAKLLSRSALEAELHPRFEVDAEGDLARAALRELIEAEIPRAYADPGDTNYLVLARKGLGPAQIEECALALFNAGARPEDLEHPLSEDRVNAFIDRLSASALQLEELSQGPIDEYSAAAKSRRLIPYLRAQAALLRSRDFDLKAFFGGEFDVLPIPKKADEAVDAQAAGAGWIDRLVDDLGDWSRGKFLKKEPVQIDTNCDLLSSAAKAWIELMKPLRRFDPELLAAGFDVVEPLLAGLRERLRTRGVLSFDDLLRAAAQLLHERPEVAARTRRGIDLLLVDEFQDTDSRQCQLVAALALEGEQRPSLFIVGDPKQSIYGWRSADLAAYEQFIDRVKANGGRLESLVVNYRSNQALLDEVERVMNGAMLAEPQIQPAFVPLVANSDTQAAQTTPANTGSAVEYWAHHDWFAERAAPKYAAGRGRMTQVDALAVAADLRALHDSCDVQWSDCALLLRSTGDLDLYVEALKRQGVPYAVTKDKSYYRRREVIEAAALVRTVLDPNDQVALVSWLRSSSVGVPDAALLPLWRAGLPRIAASLGSSADALESAQAALEAARAATPKLDALEMLPRWPLALEAALSDLHMLRRAYREQSSDRFVESLRRRTLIEVSESARFLGAYRAANLNRFFEQLTTAIEEAAGDTGHVLRRLRSGVSDALDAEEGRPQEAVDDAVQVLTVHKSKGLDFEHVYIGQTFKGKKSSGDRRAHAIAFVDGQLELRLFGVASLGWAREEQRSMRVEAAERVRLLYVAMTRAKRRVVLGGQWPLRSSAKEVEQADNLENLIALRQPPIELSDDELDGLESDPQRIALGPGVELRLTALEREALDATPSLAARTKVQHGERAAAARRDNELLMVRAASSAQRSARPRVRAISDEVHRGLWSTVEPDEWLDLERGPESAVDANERAAMAVGTCVHGFLERLSPGDETPARLQATREALRADLRDLCDAAEFELASPRLDALFSALEDGTLLARLAQLDSRVIAREMPVLLAADEAAEGPLDAYTGAIDLLIEGDDGELVVIDFKTDAVESDAALAERAEVYRPQVERYVQAVSLALGRDDVRAELWFLHADRVLPLEPGRG